LQESLKASHLTHWPRDHLSPWRGDPPPRVAAW